MQESNYYVIVSLHITCLFEMEKQMRKLYRLLILSVGLSLFIIGCVPLSFVGTSTEEVMASRQAEPIPEPITPKETVAPQVEYMVGDEGPAGGFIFYDKGKYSDGWRYMELAPEETEAGWMEWGGSGIEIKGTSADIGKGYENTKLIVSLLGNEEPKKGGPYPALICDQLVHNGVDDWFLPSNGELALIYENLIATGIGDFSKDQYGYHNFWSSTVDTSGNNFIGLAYSMTTSDGDISGTNRLFPGSYVRGARRF